MERLGGRRPPHCLWPGRLRVSGRARRVELAVPSSWAARTLCCERFRHHAAPRSSTGGALFSFFGGRLVFAKDTPVAPCTSSEEEAGWY